MFFIYGIISCGREQIVPKWDYFFKKYFMRAKTLITLLIISIAVIAGISAFYGWFLIQSDRIATGTAKPYFPYTDYSIDELNEMYPQTMNENVVTTQSPEETHQKFIAALKQGDFDEAVKCCFFESDQKEMLRVLDEVKKNDKLDMMIGDLSDISKDNVLDTRATYLYNGTSGNEKVGRFIEFVKDEKGVWRIKSL